MADLRVGDFGTVLATQILDQDGSPVDLSGATTKEIKIRSPLGVLLTENVSFTTAGAQYTTVDGVQLTASTGDGTDGQVMYVLQDGDIDVAGQWWAQWHVVTADGSWHSEDKSFRVKPVRAGTAPE